MQIYNIGAMPDLEIRCSQCAYKRVYTVNDADFSRSFTSAGEVRSENLSFISEKIHHINNFFIHEYNHGEFDLSVEGKKIGLLEVTRDDKASPYFYPGGRRV